MRGAGIGLLSSLLVLLAASDASAQVLTRRRDVPRSGSWEAGGGLSWSGSFSGPESTAELTPNTGSASFDLFTSRGRVRSGTGAWVTLGRYFSRSVAVEAGLRYSKPHLTYRLSGDAEDAAAVTAGESLTRYVITGSVVMHLRQWTFAGRAIPFVAAGAGYIRDLHEGNELIETGTEYHAAAGIKIWLGSGPRRFGLRGQAGLSIADGGFDFRDTSRTLPIASASLFYLF